MPHPDFDELFEALLGFAEQMLDEHGAFLPFAAAVDNEGELGHVPVDSAVAGNEPSPDDLIELLTGTLRLNAEQRTIRAGGMCMDVLAIPPGEDEQTDAVHIHMEHEDGEAYDVFAPYSINEEGDLEFGDIFTEEGDLTMFPAPPDSA